MKFLHAADLHLDSPMVGLSEHEGAPVDEMRGATRRALENLVEAAVENRVDLVVFGGDVFDGGWKHYGTGLFWVRQLQRLRDEGIRVAMVAGNHDAASEMSRHLTLPDGVVHLSTRAPERHVFDDIGVAVVGQGHPRRRVEDDLAARFPVADPALFTIGLLHTSLDGRPGHSSYAPTNLDVLRSRGYGYWALGHVHAREVVFRDPWVVFPGNLQGRHVRETGPKGAMIVTVGDREVSSVEPIELDVMRWASCDVELGPHDGFDDALGLVERALGEEVARAKGPEQVVDRLVAARVRLSGATAAHDELWRNREGLAAEIVARANRVGRVWIERVVVGTKRPGRLDGALVGRLAARASQMSADPAALDELEKMFEPLLAKLPAELQSADLPAAAGDSPGSRENVRASLDSAVDLLTSMLVDSDDEAETRGRS